MAVSDGRGTPALGSDLGPIAVLGELAVPYGRGTPALGWEAGGERCLGVEGDVGAGVEDNGVARRLLAGDNEEEDDEEPGRGAGSSHRKCSSSRFCKSLFPLQIRQIY